MQKTKKKTGKKSYDYLGAIQNLKKEFIAPIYTIFGEEIYLHEDLIDKILDLTIEPGTKDFNFDLFYASDTTVDKIVNVAGSYPMMAEKRLVVVKEADRYKAADLKHLSEYAKNASSTTCLVLSFPVKKLSDKWGRSIINSSISINCRQLYENEILPWIKKYVESQGMNIEIEASNLLRDQIGNSLLNLINEIEKIKVNIHPRTKITLKEVQEVTSVSKQNTIFELCDAVGEKNIVKAFAVLNNLLNTSNPVKVKIAIVTRLTHHFVNLLKIRESIRLRHTNKNELAKLTGVNPFFVNKLRQQANNYSMNQLRQAFSQLARADLHLKSSYQQPKLVLELLLYYVIKGIKVDD